MHALPVGRAVVAFVKDLTTEDGRVWVRAYHWQHVEAAVLRGLVSGHARMASSAHVVRVRSP